MLKRFEKLTTSTSGVFNWVAGIAVVSMLSISAIDLIGAKLFNRPFAGSIEIIGLLGLLIIIFSLPLTQVMGGHTAVDFFVNRLSKLAQAIIASIVSLMGLFLFAIITWQMIDYGLTIQAAGGVTPIERIPLAPSIYATAACTLLMCFVFLVSLFKTIKGARK